MTIQGPQSPAVLMQGIIKQFPGVMANDHVDFELRRGEIHALLGENGAGKSTLMTVLAGLYKPEAGSITVRGKAVRFNSPRDAMNVGVGMIHQHFTLIPTQTVTENILLGLDQPRFFIRLKQYDQIMLELGRRYGMAISPDAKIWQLAVGEQQRVEILKMLYRGVDILIMDEPTAVLAPQEIGGLIKTLRQMSAEGKSIVFISHKLNEVMSVADRVTVLRQGKVTAAGIPVGKTSIPELARLMVGRSVTLSITKPAHAPGKLVLELVDVCANNDKGLPALRNVSLSVRSGEIVGVAGVSGNGQSELAEVITGLRHTTSGSITACGEQLANKSARVAIELGVAHVPEDRSHVGTAPNLSITDNLIMKAYRQAPLANGWSLNYGLARKSAEGLKKSYAILAPNIETSVRLLSGGNIQRTILARELSGKPELLIAMQPTRGLDVGAIEGVQQLLLKQRDANAAVLLASEELDELIALSDRIVVFYEGRIVGEIANPTENDIEEIGLMMTGGKT